MAPKQGFYAVAVGRNLGVYPTWEDCEAQVKGYTACVFKRFSTMEGECAIPLCRSALRMALGSCCQKSGRTLVQFRELCQIKRSPAVYRYTIP